MVGVVQRVSGRSGLGSQSQIWGNCDVELYLASTSTDAPIFSFNLAVLQILQSILACDLRGRERAYLLNYVGPN